MHDGDLVRVHRRKHLDRFEGYVVGVGQKWMLLANLDGAIVLDGFAALRIRDVVKIQPRSTGAFVRAALTLRHQWPPAPPAGPVALGSIRALLASLGGQWPLVTVHREFEDPEVCFIGEFQHVGHKTLRLREITPRATWSDLTGKFRLDSIARIDVGGIYELALVQIADQAR